MSEPTKNFRCVQPRSLPGVEWIDRDELMLHLAFECLVQFVEKENGLKGIGEPGQDLTSFDKQTAEAIREQEVHQDIWMRECSALYEWWIKKYVPWFNDDKFNPYSEETKMHEESQAMFHRLVDVRPHLWT